MEIIEIFFSTSNKHKVYEANKIGLNFRVSFKQITVDYPEIRDESVERVAEEGVKFVYKIFNKPLIVEDSGLFIEALNGFPGPYSAYVQKKIGNKGIIKLMEGEQNRNAKFISAVSYFDGKTLKTFTGEVEGKISSEEKGGLGFGYDPVFIPSEHNKTFAEDENLKNEISHRRKSIEKFCKFTNESQTKI